MKRRTYLVAATSAAIAGCMSSDDSDPEENTTSEDDPTETDDNPEPEPESEDDEEEEEEDEEKEEEDDEEAEDEDSTKTGTFDDFEDLSKWSVLEGSLSADEDRSYVGSQSAFLQVAESDSQVRIAREFSSPKDLTDEVPGLAVTADQMVSPVIRVFDSSGDRVDYRRAITGELSFQRYNYGVSDVFGDPDMSDVSEIEIVLWNDEDEREFWLDDLHLTPRPKTGKVMIQFDDAHDTDYTRGLPVLEEYGYEAATFINPGRVGNRGRLDLEQVESLHDAGWIVANHSHTHPHLSELSDKEQESEIVDGTEWLLDHGFDEGARYFAYPFGDYDQKTVDLVEEHHDLGFAGGMPVQGYNVNPYMCTRIGDPDAERAREMLDMTAEMRGITCVFYHRLEGQRYADFKTAMEHLHELEENGDLEVILPSDLESDLRFE